MAIARIYDRATPGRYHLRVRCNGNDGVRTERFNVLRSRGARSGVGGSVAPSTTEMAVGGGLVASAAAGGSVFLVRRRRLTDGDV